MSEISDTAVPLTWRRLSLQNKKAMLFAIVVTGLACDSPASITYLGTGISTSGVDIHQPTRRRHPFEVVLTNDNGNRVLFDEHGQRHTFTRSDDGSYRATRSESGELTLTASGHDWVNQEGTRFTFSGSFPVKVTYSNGQSVDLTYRRGNLDSVRDHNGNQIEFGPQSGHTSTLLGGNSNRLLDDQCLNDGVTTTVDSTNCDQQANPAPTVEAQRTEDWIQALDARPATCNSYFVEYYGTERGAQIETGLQTLAPYNTMTSTVRSFPIVDFINGHELIVIRSRDLVNPSFNSQAEPNALLHRLLRDGREIQTRFLDPLETQGSIATTELESSTQIDFHEDFQITLQVLIRQGMASSSHWQQIEQAREQLQERYGITLEVITIP